MIPGMPPPPIHAAPSDPEAPAPPYTPLSKGQATGDAPKVLAQNPGWYQSPNRHKDASDTTGRSDVQFADDALQALPAAKPLTLSVSDIPLGLTPGARALQDNGPISNTLNGGMRAAQGAVNSVSNIVGGWLGLPPSATATGSSALFTQAMATVGVTVDPSDGSFTVPNDRRGGAMLAGAIATGGLPGDPTGTGFGAVAGLNRERLIERGASLDFMMGYDAAVDQMANGLAQQTLKDLVSAIGAMAPYAGRKAGISAGPDLRPKINGAPIDTGIVQAPKTQTGVTAGGQTFNLSVPVPFSPNRPPLAAEVTRMPYLSGNSGLKVAGKMTPEQIQAMDFTAKPVTRSGEAKLSGGNRPTSSDVHRVNSFQVKTNVANLPENERELLIDYTVSSYRVINKDLREGTPDARAKATVAVVDKVAVNLPPGTVLTRGVSDRSGALGEAIRAGGVGAVYTDPALVSTSISAPEDNGFTKGKLVFRFKTSAGTTTDPSTVRGVYVGTGTERTTSKPNEPHQASTVSGYGDENEVVLPANTRFVVTGTSQQPDQYGVEQTVVDAILLPNAVPE